jgi:hypothetical protein
VDHLRPLAETRVWATLEPQHRDSYDMSQRFVCIIGEEEVSPIIESVQLPLSRGLARRRMAVQDVYL